MKKLNQSGPPPKEISLIRSTDPKFTEFPEGLLKKWS